MKIKLLENINMKKTKYVLPSMVTSCSLLFSFLAVVSAFDGFFEKACFYLIMAAFADAIDGRVARYTNSQSVFGAAYDSIADVVSFGAAPALILYSWVLKELGSLGAIISFLYLLGVALRLAKFDTMPPVKDLTSEQKKERRLYFFGLPCPAAAVTLIGWLWFVQSIGFEKFSYVLHIFVAIITTAITLYLAAMMLSNIKFRSLKDSDGEGHFSYLYIILFLLMILLLFTVPQKMTFIGMMTYSATGPVLLFVNYLNKDKEKQKLAAENSNELSK